MGTGGVDAMEERGERAKRVRLIQEEIYPGTSDNPDNVRFANLLKDTAADLGIPHPSMNPNRVAKLRSGGQLLSFEDAAVLAAVDPLGRGWLWLVFGVEAREDVTPKEDRGQATDAPDSDSSAHVVGRRRPDR